MPKKYCPLLMLYAAAMTACNPVAASVDDDSIAPAWRSWHGVLFRLTPPLVAAQLDAPAPASSFVFASIHYGSLDELALDADALRDVIVSTQTLVDEADASASFDAETDRHRFLAPPDSLPKLIGAKAFDNLLPLMPDVPAERLQKLKPWVVLSVLESRGEIASPANRDKQLDGRISRWADEAGLRRVHLETLNEQMAALDCVPAREQAQVLARRIEAPWVLKEQSLRVLGYYRSRDLPAWLDEIDAMTGLDAAAKAIETRAKDCLLAERNRRWIGRLDALLRSGSCFVAVGAMHLTGESGLLAELVQRGYQLSVEPI
ncbi:MAG: hypothetical protein JWQ90_653 [Hydrocarboniphaga sp.]|uniref:TraB/GumN family protein n=1 Tax=Hydrocarboniphaga sp. TaxID=2033016 RepID=UPI00262DF747|nr:TraB/GumN family protein [Hydrocarboniphaga sp.]MDB5968203.1 hypothetical protein [Hydrocarboniphaga sp.]